MIIAFSGMDYSGKSTQIEILRQEYKGLYIWSRIGYTPLLKFFKHLIRYFKKNRPAEKIQHHAELSNKTNVLDLWFLSAFVDYIIFGIYLKIQNLFGKNIILDRYILDALVDVSVRYGLNSWRCFLIKSVYDIVFPKPDKYFFLTIEAEQFEIRRKNKMDPFPVSNKQLNLLRVKYDHFISKLDGINLMIIDASGEKADVSKLIKSILADEA